MEGHGPHLPLDTDVRICEEVCRRLGEQIPGEVVILPALAYGVSPHHLDFPGSLAISELTYVQFVVDILGSLAHHGFRRMLVVNGHGGNQSAIEMATRMVSLRYPETLCATLAYYLLPSFRRREAEIGPGDTRGSMGHADFTETALYLAIDREAVAMDRAVAGAPPAEALIGFAAEDAPVVMMQHWSAITASGVLGDPRQATPEAGEELLRAAVKDLVEVVRALQRMRPGVRVDHRLTGGGGTEL